MGWGIPYHPIPMDTDSYTAPLWAKERSPYTPKKKPSVWSLLFFSAWDTGGKRATCNKNKTRSGVFFAVRGMKIIKSRRGWWDSLLSHSHIMILLQVILKALKKARKKKPAEQDRNIFFIIFSETRILLQTRWIWFCLSATCKTHFIIIVWYLHIQCQRLGFLRACRVICFPGTALVAETIWGEDHLLKRNWNGWPKGFLEKGRDLEAWEGFVVGGETNLAMSGKAPVGFTRAKQWEEMRLCKLSSIVSSSLSGYFPRVLFGNQRDVYSTNPYRAPHI